MTIMTSTVEKHFIRYPKEVVEEWIMSDALKAGVVCENATFTIVDVNYNPADDYIEIDGEFNKRIDA